MKNLSKIFMVLICITIALIVLFFLVTLQVFIGTNYIPLNGLAAIGAFVISYNFFISKKAMKKENFYLLIR